VVGHSELLDRDPDRDLDCAPTEISDASPELGREPLAPISEAPPGDPDPWLPRDIEALEAIIQEKTEPLTECERQFESRLDPRSCEVRDELLKAEETINELSIRLEACEAEPYELIRTLMLENETIHSIAHGQRRQIRALKSHITTLEWLIADSPKRQEEPREDQSKDPSTIPAMIAERSLMNPSESRICFTTGKISMACAT
jgi:hypothetical protein